MIYCVEPTELVQRFVDRGSSHRRKSASKQIIDIDLPISLAYPSGGEAYFTCSHYFYTCLCGAWRRGGRVSTLCNDTDTTHSNLCFKICTGYQCSYNKAQLLQYSVVCVHKTNSANNGPIIKINEFLFFLSCTG